MTSRRSRYVVIINDVLFAIMRRQLKLNLLEMKDRSRVDASTHQHKQSNKNKQIDKLIEWEAVHVDGKYYLTDQISLLKLRQLEAEIQRQKNKFNQLQHVNPQLNNQSFLSLQNAIDSSDNSQGCITDINQSILAQRRHQAELDLEQQEQKYRKKLNQNHQTNAQNSLKINKHFNKLKSDNPNTSKNKQPPNTHNQIETPISSAIHTSEHRKYVIEVNQPPNYHSQLPNNHQNNLPNTINQPEKSLNKSQLKQPNTKSIKQSDKISNKSISQNKVEKKDQIQEERKSKYDLKTDNNKQQTNQIILDKNSNLKYDTNQEDHHSSRKTSIKQIQNSKNVDNISHKQSSNLQSKKFNKEVSQDKKSQTNNKQQHNLLNVQLKTQKKSQISKKQSNKPKQQYNIQSAQLKTQKKSQISKKQSNKPKQQYNIQSAQLKTQKKSQISKKQSNKPKQQYNIQSAQLKTQKKSQISKKQSNKPKQQHNLLNVQLRTQKKSQISKKQSNKPKQQNNLLNIELKTQKKSQISKKQSNINKTIQNEQIIGIQSFKQPYKLQSSKIEKAKSQYKMLKDQQYNRNQLKNQQSRRDYQSSKQPSHSANKSNKKNEVDVKSKKSQQLIQNQYIQIKSQRKSEYSQNKPRNTNNIQHLMSVNDSKNYGANVQFKDNNQKIQKQSQLQADQRSINKKSESNIQQSFQKQGSYKKQKDDQYIKEKQFNNNQLSKKSSAHSNTKNKKITQSRIQKNNQINQQTITNKSIPIPSQRQKKNQSYLQQKSEKIAKQKSQVSKRSNLNHQKNSQFFVENQNEVNKSVVSVNKSNKIQQNMFEGNNQQMIIKSNKNSPQKQIGKIGNKYITSKEKNKQDNQIDNNNKKIQKYQQSISSIPIYNPMILNQSDRFENKSVQWSQKPSQNHNYNKVQKNQKNINPSFNKVSNKIYNDYKTNKESQKKQHYNDHKSQFKNKQIPQSNYQQASQKKLQQNKNKSKSIKKQSSKPNSQRNSQKMPNHQKIYQNQNLQDKNYSNNQERKNKSFVIHYQKQQSVLSKSRKNSQKKSQSQLQAKSAKKQLIKQQKLIKISQNHSESVPKKQIDKLNLKISMLEKQLEKIQQKQNQMQRIESNMIKKPFSQENISGSLSPIPNSNDLPKIIPQNNLNLSSSILQYNYHQQKAKKNIQELDINEKQKLKQQIAHLKKIIREIQIQKIKSIQQNNDHITITTQKLQDTEQKSFIDHKGRSSRLVEKWKQSINSNDLGSAKQLQWNSQVLKKQKNIQQGPINNEIGKIIKNSPTKSVLQPPKRAYKARLFNMLKDKQQQFTNLGNITTQLQPIPLRKYQSNSPRRNNQKKQTKQQILNRLNMSQRDFQQYVSSCKVSQEPEFKFQLPQNSINNYQRKQQALVSERVQAEPSMFQQLQNHSKSYLEEQNQPISRVNTNKNQIVVPEEIYFSDWQIPVIPETPSQQLNQQQLLQLAKQAYKVFGIQIDQKQEHFRIKKYKNCVVFCTDSSQSSILWHFSGKFYIGGWKNNQVNEGQKFGDGIQIVPGKHAYKGQFYLGKKHGNGILKTFTGTIYQGQWIQGAKCGRGKYYDSITGQTYYGQWKDGKKNGFGILKFSQKQYYQGTFVKSIKQGYGFEKFANEDTYKGEYLNGQFHGKGKYCWANGSSYEGNFFQGKRHGQGQWNSNPTKGDYYIGQYSNDKKNGYGRYIWSNGCIYQGNFDNDLKHGKGRMINKDEKQIKGVWNKGNLVQTEGVKKQVIHQQQPVRKSLKVSSPLKGQPNKLFVSAKYDYTQ